MKLDHLVFKASDLEKSAEFYSALLPIIGFVQVGEFHWKNQDNLSIVLQKASADTSPYQRYGPGLNHFAFNAESETMFDEVLSEISKTDIVLPAVQTFENGRSVFIPDPDGLRLEIALEKV
jgi:catechol 2,3-dioxygenase-like lactoylglutathione lyase family enzyme